MSSKSFYVIKNCLKLLHISTYDSISKSINESFRSKTETKLIIHFQFNSPLTLVFNTNDRLVQWLYFLLNVQSRLSFRAATNDYFY